MFLLRSFTIWSAPKSSIAMSKLTILCELLFVMRSRIFSMRKFFFQPFNQWPMKNWRSFVSFSPYHLLHFCMCVVCGFCAVSCWLLALVVSVCIRSFRLHFWFFVWHNTNETATTATTFMNNVSFAAIYL